MWTYRNYGGATSRVGCGSTTRSSGYEERGIQIGFEQGIEQGIARGVEQGIAQDLLRGQQHSLLRILTAKFGAAPGSRQVG